MLEQKCSQNVHPDFLVLKLRGLSSLPGFPHVGGAGMPRRAGVPRAHDTQRNNGEVNSMAVECIPCSSFVPGNLSPTIQRSTAT